MRDPVLVAQTGHTYERTAIENWLREHSTDPRPCPHRQTLHLPELASTHQNDPIGLLKCHPPSPLPSTPLLLYTANPPTRPA